MSGGSHAKLASGLAAPMHVNLRGRDHDRRDRWWLEKTSPQDRGGCAGRNIAPFEMTQWVISITIVVVKARCDEFLGRCRERPRSSSLPISSD
jgi:hypothetical protein